MMRTVDAGGRQIAYQRAGSGESLVLLHGFLADSRAWCPQIEGLSDAFDVIAWDAPGCGQSSDPPESWRMGEWAEALAGFLDALEVGRSHVCGLSWGGTLAQEFYGRYPERVRSLVLADTYTGWAGSFPPEVVAARLEKCIRESTMDPAEFLPGWMPGFLSNDAAVEMVDELAAIVSEFHPTGFRAMATALAESDTREVLPGIQVPTLLIWGECDARSPLSIADQIRAAIPNARLVAVPGGHVSNVEQALRFNAEVRAFLQAMRPS